MRYSELQLYKDSLIRLIDEAIDFLLEFGYSAQADWLRQRAEIFKTEDIRSEAFQSALRELGRFLYGMGSFTDLVLTPPPPSSRFSQLTDSELERLQYGLANQISSVADVLSLDKPTRQSR